MPLHIDVLETEVIAEPAPVSTREQARPVWQELERLRALRARLLRDRLRTEASGEHG